MKTELTPDRTNAEAQRTQSSAEEKINGFLRVSPRPRRLCVSPLLAALLLGVFALIPSAVQAQTNNLTALLQQGLFEEQANRNLDAAISNYQSLATQFDKDRQLAATAVFRLGECYRAQGKTNEAAAQYQRILRDFSDEQTLVTLSRQDLAGMRFPQSAAGKTIEHFDEASAEANSLATQISGIEGLQSDPEEQARAVIAIFPDDVLKSMMSQLMRLQEQAERAKANPQLTVRDLIVRDEDYSVVSFDGKLIRAILLSSGTNLDLLANFQRESGTQLTGIKERVNFVLGIQKARLKVLLTATRSETTPGIGQGKSNSAVTDEEDQEIARIQQMIQNSPDLINARGESGNTPLTQAAYKGWLKVTAYLMDHGADVNGGGIAALNAAATAGNRAMVELLLSRGADVNRKGGEGKTPLHTAAERKFQAVMEALLANKADVNAQDNYGYTPLLLAAQNGQTNIAQMLLTAGANVNVEDSQGRTPLSFAVDGGSVEIIKMLLVAKADPNGGNLDAPLLVAISKKDAMSVELLLQAGANPNAKGAVTWDVFINGSSHWAAGHPSETPLFLAVSTKQLPMVQLLLKFKADPNDSQTDGQSLLFGTLDQPDILAALLDAGAKVDVRTPQSWTLLSGAIPDTNAASVEILLKHGANPNATDNQGNTPLHVATDNLASDKIFQLLFNSKADPNVRNNQGRTPLEGLKQILKDNPSLEKTYLDRFEHVADVLRQHGALDKLPDWDRITVSRPSANFSQAVFQKGTNDWNQFTLLEAIFNFYESQSPSFFSLPIEQRLLDRDYSGSLSFPDLAQIVVVRHHPGTTNETRIKMNLLNSTNRIDFAQDMPLEFGDVVEIPERNHRLGNRPVGLTASEILSIAIYLKGSVLLVTRDQKVELTIYSSAAQSLVGCVLQQPKAQYVLSSSSDLSHVKITRHDAKTGKTHEWIVDCSDHQLSGNGTLELTGNLITGANSMVVTGANPMGNSQSSSGLWLRDGDVIEVPEKP
jgi:ankyrin repeat protein